MAFIVAGLARDLGHPALLESYQRLVLRAFGANPAAQLFLYLTGNESQHTLDVAIKALRPARWSVVPANHHSMTAPSGTCLPRGQTWKDASYQRTALRWWGALNASWAMVLSWERVFAVRFHTIFFSRPDLLFTHAMGPLCTHTHYDGRTWYVPGLGSPDHLWLMPRHVAAAVLTSVDTFLACRPGDDCCRLQQSGSPLDSLRFDEWKFSFWPLTFWTRHANFTVSTALRGSAVLLAKTAADKSFGISAANGAAHIGCGKPNCGRRSSRRSSCDRATLEQSAAALRADAYSRARRGPRLLYLN